MALGLKLSSSYAVLLATTVLHLIVKNWAHKAQELQRQRHGQGQSKNVKVNDLGGQGVGTRGFVGWHPINMLHKNTWIDESTNLYT